jgi:hypothetical protein
MFDIISTMQKATIHDLKERVVADHMALRDGLERATGAVGAADREMLRWVLSCDRSVLWRHDGCRSMAEALWQGRDLELEGPPLGRGGLCPPAPALGIPRERSFVSGQGRGTHEVRDARDGEGPHRLSPSGHGRHHPQKGRRGYKTLR